jgi:hypothetical protein
MSTLHDLMLLFMKQPEINPFEKEVTHVDTLYHTIGLYSHYINSECILTKNKVVTKGKHYLFASTESEYTAPIVRKIMVLDAFYHREKVHLFALDKNSNRVFIIDVNFENKEKECPWLLADLKDYDKITEYMEIKLFCKNDCCTPTVSSDLNYNQKKDNLLDFDF